MVKESDIFKHFTEEGLKDPRHKDTYQKIFEALEEPPGFKLPSNFAKSVIAKIELMEQKKKRWFYTFMTFGVFIMISTFGAAMVYSFGLDGLAQFKQGIYWAVFVGIIVVVIQYLDQKLVRKKTFSVI